MPTLTVPCRRTRRRIASLSSTIASIHSLISPYATVLLEKSPHPKRLSRIFPVVSRRPAHWFPHGLYLQHSLGSIISPWHRLDMVRFLISLNQHNMISLASPPIPPASTVPLRRWLLVCLHLGYAPGLVACCRSIPAYTGMYWPIYATLLAAISDLSLSTRTYVKPTCLVDTA